MEESKKDEVQTSLKTEQTELKPESVSSEQTDYDSKLKESEARIAKLTEERDNYRTGNNKWRKIAKEREDQSYVGENPETLDEDKVKAIVQETLMSSQIAQAVAEKENLIRQMSKELSEAKIALKNKPSDLNTASGSNQEKPEVKTEFFTKEQLEDLKAKGIDPNKVIENLRKVQGK